MHVQTTRGILGSEAPFPRLRPAVKRQPLRYCNPDPAPECGGRQRRKKVERKLHLADKKPETLGFLPSGKHQTLESVKRLKGKLCLHLQRNVHF
ncbi:hypothetical protein Y1Q_0017673 [Alligator mississippiensis]|uniref:Uncharacterized protein n=1 Tax=Alligator mississippiensis TaxID=8496 RepID=A0A151NGL5_ALLMI|nr:hypothetical protein Y1Q_0017673 [Alligator mississippiensis]